MKESICIWLDEELNNLVNEETKNGFDLDEFVNASLRNNFNIETQEEMKEEMINKLKEKLEERHSVFMSPASNFMRDGMCYQDSELNKITHEINQILKIIADSTTEYCEGDIKANGTDMVQIILNEKEILETIKTRVGSNGQISVGKKHAGKQVTAYVVLSETR